MSTYAQRQCVKRRRIALTGMIGFRCKGKPCPNYIRANATNDPDIIAYCCCTWCGTLHRIRCGKVSKLTAATSGREDGGE